MRFLFKNKVYQYLFCCSMYKHANKRKLHFGFSVPTSVTFKNKDRKLTCQEKKKYECYPQSSKFGRMFCNKKPNKSRTNILKIIFFQNLTLFLVLTILLNNPMSMSVFMDLSWASSRTSTEYLLNRKSPLSSCSNVPSVMNLISVSFVTVLASLWNF